VAKTIKLFFVRPNGQGLLLEGENLRQYNLLHQQAIAAYQKVYRVLEKISGRRVNISYQADKSPLIPADEQNQPANQIIMIKDDGTTILLENEAFTFYQDHHFTGLALLKKKSVIKGQAVRVMIT
jgi:hypothetical protein